MLREVLVLCAIAPVVPFVPGVVLLPQLAAPPSCAPVDLGVRPAFQTHAAGPARQGGAVALWR
jgi:hypothetical protein